MGVIVGIVGIIIASGMVVVLGGAGFFDKSKPEAALVAPAVTEAAVKESIKDLAAPTPLIQRIPAQDPNCNGSLLDTTKVKTVPAVKVPVSTP